MAAKERIYLFHGNDSRASRQAVQRWLAVFQEKYGDTTRYIIDADEGSGDIIRRQLEEIIGGSTLFSEPKLVIIKRATNADKARSTAASKALVEVLEMVAEQDDQDITVMVWEDKQLAESSPVMKWFAGQSEKKKAKVYTHSVAQGAALGTRIDAYLEEQGYRMQSAALTLLTNLYRQQEKAQRVAKRLRATDSLAEDMRGWWLYQVLDTAMLQATGDTITVQDIERSVAVEHPVNVFEIVNALSAARYREVRNLVKDWEATAVEGDYFGLYALLRNHFRRENNQHALQLLAEIEIISKNTQLRHSWLFELFLIRMETGRRGNKRRLLEPRKLWLATLPRS